MDIKELKKLIKEGDAKIVENKENDEYRQRWWELKVVKQEVIDTLSKNPMRFNQIKRRWNLSGSLLLYWLRHTKGFKRVITKDDVKYWYYEKEEE